MAADRDFYQVLGVPRTASQEDIQRAYRKLARSHHPDVNSGPGAEERFKEVSEAYDVLSDPETRRRYDAFGPEFRQVPEGVDPGTWARARTGSRAGAGPGDEEIRFGPGFGPGFGGGVDGDFDGDFDGGLGGGFGGGTGEGFDFEEIFGGLFGGRTTRGASRGWGTVPGADQEAEIELTVEEAYRGGRRSITLAGPDGPRKFDVTIPAGVTEGQRIRLAGQGGRGSTGARPGDLYLVVRIAPHPRYRVQGRDLHTELPLIPWEAALGATVPVSTPDGEARVTVPPGTSSGRRLRLRGRGLPNPRGRPGDLYAEARIMVPAQLSDAERHLYSQLATVSSFDPRRQP